ncbi:uncharacterized protein LOC110714882 [Chenopodium quinoa]|uniref:uncharacterized protein LOC110714882 n=1 Tax=Chenopodium quinoa TaxID=63459 RepID=UPI000B775D84|nr:uncharacterized protein LOC110714882 [Chenopodium quinoa]
MHRKLMRPQRKDPSSSYVKHISPRSFSKGQQWPPSAAGHSVSTTPSAYQPYGLQEDIEWAIHVALNELGGFQRNCEYLTNQLGKEDSKSLLDVNHHLEACFYYYFNV